MAKEQQKEIQIITESKAKQRVKSKGSKAVVFLLVFSSFFLGIVLGMLVIHNKSQKQIAEVNEELATVIREQSAINITNVYVPERKINEGKIAMNSFNTENFRVEDGFMAYFDENGNKISHLGVDLSYHNDKVNWAQLAASGCEFVMLRCGYRGYTEGGLLEDEKFVEYAKKANEMGINLGVYFFTQSITVDEAVEEAEYVLKLIENAGVTLQYPIAYDTEYINDEAARTNVTEISDELRSEMCIAFCERIRQEGYYPIIYASENWMRRNMNLKALTDYEFWAPQYLDENDFLFDFSIWQYSEDGYIPGVEGEVDLNISMVDYASFVPQMREAYLSGGVIETIQSKGEVVITTSREDDPGESAEPAEDSMDIVENPEEEIDAEELNDI